MGQRELAASLANSVQLTHGVVYSSRAGVNVILPGTGERGEGNHVFGVFRGRGARVEQVRALVRAVIEDEAQNHPRGWMATRNYVVFVRPDHSVRGKYSFAVWSEDRAVVRQMDSTRWHSNGIAGHTITRNAAEAEAMAERIRGTLTPGQSVIVLSGRAASAYFEGRI